MKYQCTGVVTGSKYLGEVKADSEEEAKEKAFALESAFIGGLCHECSKECEDPEIHEIND